MDKCGKVFRRELHSADFTLVPYDPSVQKYYSVIKEEREKGHQQVIINSEIMMNIMYAIVDSGSIVQTIKLSDASDNELNKQIEAILSKLRRDRWFFMKLKDALLWATDNQCIDIERLQVAINSDDRIMSYSIYSTGILEGENIESLFNVIIEPVLTEYFSE
ncbi:hypothetical protein BMT55_11690 [Listeria newyorkensis]|uniref:Uncharacterized protein n=1 Tax=Listeria newyorkensis TaxID=1497681 RepID=A0ABX4XKI0_9LIST|nr:hypothetical protein [Listeria newyorkensis]PNP90633.1 hypothetical protein BMT55_11690 [Listeria newyorkensis]